jgi:hypothetical protein
VSLAHLQYTRARARNELRNPGSGLALQRENLVRARALAHPLAELSAFHKAFMANGQYVASHQHHQGLS